MNERRFATAEQLLKKQDGAFVTYCGILRPRQQPKTAKGVIFVSLEDETGNVQVIVWPDESEAQPKELMLTRLMVVNGRWQGEGDACSLIAKRLEDLTPLLGELEMGSKEFH